MSKKIEEYFDQAMYDKPDVAETEEFEDDDMGTEFEIGAQRAAEAAHCILGSLGKILRWSDLTHRRNTPNLPEGHIVQFAEDDLNKHFGKYVWVLKSKLPKLGMDIIEFTADYYNININDAAELLNPPDIVDNAGAWDDPQFVSAVWQAMEYGKINVQSGYELDNGAVVLDINEVELENYSEQAVNNLYTANKHTGQAYNGFLDTIEGIPYSETCYHGTSITNIDDFFSELEIGYSEWNAVWVTPNENEAEWFTMWNANEEDKPIEVIFKLDVNLENALELGMSYAWLQQEIKDYYDCSDLRECIDPLIDAGFDGWVGNMSMGSDIGTDIAVFDPNKIDIKEVKFKFPGKEWTEYMDIESSFDFLENYLD